MNYITYYIIGCLRSTQWIHSEKKVPFFSKLKGYLRIWRKKIRGDESTVVLDKHVNYYKSYNGMIK